MITTDVGVLDKIMNILSFFRAEPDKYFDIKSISDLTGYNFSTTYRLIHAMAIHDMLTGTPEGYTLGKLFCNNHRLSKAGLDNLPEIARPIMERLNDDINENVHLVTRYDNSRCIIACIPSSKPIRPVAIIGEPKPLWLGATGEVLLAFLNNDQKALHLAAESSERFSQKKMSKDTLKLLEKTFQTVRKQGYSVTIGARVADLTSIACPVFFKNGTIAAALAIVVPNAQLPDPSTIENYIPKAMFYAQQITQGLE